MTFVFRAARHRKSPRLLEIAREQSKNLNSIVTLTTEFVKEQTYHAKHRNEWWNKDLTDNQRAWLSMLFGLIYGAIIFAAMTT